MKRARDNVTKARRKAAASSKKRRIDRTPLPQDCKIITYFVYEKEPSECRGYCMIGSNSNVNRVHEVISKFYFHERDSTEPAPLTAWLLDEVSKPNGPQWSTRLTEEEGRIKSCYQRMNQCLKKPGDLTWLRLDMPCWPDTVITTLGDIQLIAGFYDNV